MKAQKVGLTVDRVGPFQIVRRDVKCTCRVCGQTTIRQVDFIERREAVKPRVGDMDTAVENRRSNTTACSNCTSSDVFMVAVKRKRGEK